MCSSSPDTSRQDAVAAEAQHLSEDQWNWVKQQYTDEAPQRAAAADMATKVSQAQLDQMQKSGALADESAANYRRIYQPMEEQAARDAQTYDSVDNQNAAAGRAVADVQTAASTQQGITQRNLASQGINASDGAYAAAQGESQNTAMLAEAGAANNAREQVKTVGRAMRNDVISTGRGVVGTQGTQAGLTLTAGNSATGTAQVPVQVAQSGVGMVAQGAGQAQQGLTTAANIYQNSSQAQTAAKSANGQATAGLAGAAMTAAALF